MSIRKEWIVVLAAATALTGCAGYGTSTKTASPTSTATTTTTASPTATSEVKSGTQKLTIKDFTTTPNTMTVKKGTVIEVTNEDIAGHSVTADDNSFDTGVLGQGKSGKITLNTVGTFKFHCTPHPTRTGLMGTITVVE